MESESVIVPVIVIITAIREQCWCQIVDGSGFRFPEILKFLKIKECNRIQLYYWNSSIVMEFYYIQ